MPSYNPPAILHFPDGHEGTLTSGSYELTDLHAGICHDSKYYYHMIRTIKGTKHLYLKERNYLGKRPKMVEVILQSINNPHYKKEKVLPFTMYKKNKRCKDDGTIFIMIKATQLKPDDEYFRVGSGSVFGSYSCLI